jgi:hypothetical protein
MHPLPAMLVVILAATVRVLARTRQSLASTVEVSPRIRVGCDENTKKDHDSAQPL